MDNLRTTVPALAALIDDHEHASLHLRALQGEFNQERSYVLQKVAPELAELDMRFTPLIAEASEWVQRAFDTLKPWLIARAKIVPPKERTLSGEVNTYIYRSGVTRWNDKMLLKLIDQLPEQYRAPLLACREEGDPTIAVKAKPIDEEGPIERNKLTEAADPTL